MDILTIQNQYTKLTSFLHNLSQFYIHTLHRSPDALKYCEERKLTQEKLTAFDIGLAPDPSLTRSFLQLNNIPESFLFDSGIWMSPENPFDLFSGRLIFPLKDIAGIIVGFSGRQWLGVVKRAKYINTSSTEIFQKSLLLYNLHNAIPTILQMGYVILVEGMMDVIALCSIGIKNVVAPCGTAFTQEQIKILSLFTKYFVLCYDKDTAGIKATDKSIELCHSISSDIIIKTLTLVPPVIIIDSDLKLDPDSYINNYGASCFFGLLNSLFTT